MKSRLSRFTAVLSALTVMVGAEARSLQAQEPPDSIPPVVADTLNLSAADSLASDTLNAAGAAGDTVTADSIPIVRLLNDMPADLPRPERTGVDTWRWDRAALLGRPNFTLIELLQELPGTIPLRYGDYGSPEGVVWNGMAGGRLRVFFDGVEEIGLAGNGPDLSRIPIVALDEVVVRRSGGEIRIELHGQSPRDARPMSMIEAGTGDLDTNFFRGTFVHPDALGGGLGVGIERLDTQGPGGNEQGSRQGVWLRYLRPVGERLTLAAEIRRGISEHFLDRGPSKIQRNTSMLRGRWAFSENLGAELFYARNSLTETGDTLSPIAATRNQFGGRIGWENETTWLRGEVRAFDGGTPGLRVDVDGGMAVDDIGWAGARLGMDRFDGEQRMVLGLSARSTPRFGVSAFGSIDVGERGWRAGVDTLMATAADTTSAGEPITDPALRPLTAFTSRDQLRLGLSWSGWGADLSAAWLSTKTDSIRPTATFLDRDGVAFSGDEVSGWEADLRYKLPWEGFSLNASWQQWDTPGIFRPEEIYRGGIRFHRVYYDTGNFEFWWGIQAVGRSAMQLPFADADLSTADQMVPVTVPFQQTWDAYLQIRVVTVRIFLRFENLGVRERNQDFPGRILPATRAIYGVRWTLWN